MCPWHVILFYGLWVPPLEGAVKMHLSNLGVLPVPLLSAEMALTIKLDRKASVISTACAGVTPSVLGVPPGAAEVRAAVRAELLRRVRQAEARAELQQRKLQQQQRQQLEQLAASLREVERDVEAVKSALAAEGPEELSKTKEELPVRPYSACVRSTFQGSLSSSPLRSGPIDFEVRASCTLFHYFCLQSLPIVAGLP